MIRRYVQPRLRQLLGESPAVVLVGPRQAGKTTLALSIAAERPSVYLDLELASDRAKLADPEHFLSALEDKLVILDEVHRVPGIFQPLRGLIDRGRRNGRRVGRFLLLGSASVELLRQSGESLAGRLAHLEMTPFHVMEVGEPRQDTLWIRGGFPDSVLAESDAKSMRWRRDFIRTYLERDIAQLVPRIPAETLRRCWTMLAHRQGGLLNAAELARALSVDGKTVAGYLDLLVDLLLVRRLPAWHRNAGKRLVRSPKVFVRDSGLVHTLLGLGDREAVLGHPVVGASWEGMVVETLVAVAPEGAQACFYRTSAGAEIDLVLELPGGGVWAIEIKRGLAPRLDKGFHIACEDLEPARRLVVYSGRERYAVAKDVEAISLAEAADELAAA